MHPCRQARRCIFYVWLCCHWLGQGASVLARLFGATTTASARALFFTTLMRQRPGCPRGAGRFHCAAALLSLRPPRILLVCRNWDKARVSITTAPARGAAFDPFLQRSGR